MELTALNHTQSVATDRSLCLWEPQRQCWSFWLVWQPAQELPHQDQGRQASPLVRVSWAVRMPCFNRRYTLSVYKGRLTASLPTAAAIELSSLGGRDGWDTRRLTREDRCRPGRSSTHQGPASRAGHQTSFAEQASASDEAFRNPISSAR